MRHLIIILCFVFASPCFGASALYRISSGEVYKISNDNDAYSTNNVYLDTINDVTLSDGIDTRDPGDEFRVLGYSKILVGTTIRNATQIEIDTFAAFALTDAREIEVDGVREYFRNSPNFRRFMKAFAAVLIEREFNEYRTWFTDFQAEVAASTSLADFKTRMATLPAMPQRTIFQLITQVENRISTDD